MKQYKVGPLSGLYIRLEIGGIEMEPLRQALINTFGQFKLVASLQQANGRNEYQ